MPLSFLARARAYLLTGACLLSALCASACLVDNSDRCGSHQTYDGKRCICDGGYGLIGTQCVKCGAHEDGSLSGCACATGYVRSSDTAPCRKSMAGAPCSADGDCKDPHNDYCVLDGDAGYCTSRDCPTSGACDTDQSYGCNDRMSPSFCERPPAGLGKACTSDKDCAGSAASFCETAQSMSCLVNDCKSNPDKCHGDWVCCDISVLGTSLCIPPSELASGMCPVDGTLIPRTK